MGRRKPPVISPGFTMDLYLFCFCLGFLGFAVMTLLGLSHTHGDGPHSAATTHGHDTAHAELGHGHHAQHGDHGVHASPPKLHGHDAKPLWLLLSPRVLFSLLLGFGATGLILRNLLSEPILLMVAALSAWIFHRYIVDPLWQFFFRFASSPARTLESAILEQAEAVANFDSHGQGLVALQLDGQIVQMLGRLNLEDREQGVRVRSGDRLMIVDVDPKRHCCTVTRVRGEA